MKNKLGKSDVKVSPLTLGTFAIGGLMWGGNDRKDSVAAIRSSMDEGITSIDTAPFYGLGLSEEVVGEAIQSYDRSQIEILTKFGLVWEPEVKGSYAFDASFEGKSFPVYKNGTKANVIREVENSLKRLNTDYIDLIQLHWPDPQTPVAETMEAMQHLMQQGKVRAIGVSNYDTAQLAEGMERVVIHSNQVPYSMLKREIEMTLIPFALKDDIGIIAYSPLERGLLTGKYTDGAATLSSDDHRNVYFQQFESDRLKKLLNTLQDIAASKNCSVTQLVLAWTIQQKGITTVLAGARNKEQALHNAKALHVSLHNDELAIINQYL